MKQQPTTIFDVVTRCVVVDFDGQTDLLGPFPDRATAMREAARHIEEKRKERGDDATTTGRDDAG